MLTRELAIAEFDFARGSVHPDRLTMKSHGRYLACADQMLDVYRQGVGRTRRELHRAVAEVFAGEDDCPQRRIDAFCFQDDPAVCKPGAAHAQDRAAGVGRIFVPVRWSGLDRPRDAPLRSGPGAVSAGACRLPRLENARRRAVALRELEAGTRPL